MKSVSFFFQRTARFLLGTLGITMVASLWIGCSTSSVRHSKPLRQALTFYASFDGQIDADFALGDPALYFAPSMKQPRVGTRGLPPSGVITRAHGQGRFGDALRFHKKASEMIFFQAERNVAYPTNRWQSTVSFWLRVDPMGELATGFCDPIQITAREWNDAAFFVEFEKRAESIPFRLGAYADFNVWNPQNREWSKISFGEKPLVHIETPPFGGDRWTHVAFTFENFNTGQADGVANLYLNGELRGSLSPRTQTFTWKPAQALVMLGLGYIGLWDELAIFNRALSAHEIKSLYELDGGVRTLLK